MDLILIGLFLATGIAIISMALRGRKRRTDPTPHLSYGPFRYTSEHGDHYLFDIRRAADGEVRAYILEQPPYGRRPSDGESTHRLGLADGRPYVCVEPRLAPTNVRHARDWAGHWADGTSQYIRTGRKFS